MAKTYEPADTATTALVAGVIAQHHPPLAATEVTVDVMFVAAEDKDGNATPALKHRGYPVAAQIQITSLVDRVRGVPDAKLTLDRYAWTRTSEASRLALIDHELAHVVLVVDIEGAPMPDDRGRPKLRMRPHDYELTGFADVAARHGEAAVEVRALRAFRFEQLPLFCPDGLA